MLRVPQRFEAPHRSVDPYERVTYSLAVQFVQFVVLIEWAALWALPRHDASSVVGLEFESCSSQFSHFCCFSPPAATLVGLSGFPPAVRSTHLFSCLVEARGASSVVLTVAWISLALAKGTIWLSLCVELNHRRRTVRVKLNLQFIRLELKVFGQGARRGVKHAFRKHVPAACACAE